MLGNTPKVWRDSKCISRVDASVSLEQLQRVARPHDAPDGAASLGSGVHTAVSSTKSTLDVSSDAFRHQRIEHECLFVPYGMAESCRLMPRSECHRQRVAIDDDANNQLALSRDMRGWYDGIACDIPIVNIRAGAVEATPSVDGRYKVELLVTVLDAGCAFRVFSRLHSTAVETDDPLTMKTHVFAADPAKFVRCLLFKHEHNAEWWRDFLCAD